jgi:hypothetical protein
MLVKLISTESLDGLNRQDRVINSLHIDNAQISSGLGVLEPHLWSPSFA